ncbi:hypothetical protein RSAG8_09255, partial [Rhizoctonia solani AG-8 WAC10335]
MVHKTIRRTHRLTIPALLTPILLISHSVPRFSKYISWPYVLQLFSRLRPYQI